MLAGTARAPDEVVGAVPPDYAECTVEKVAINAVLAGCKPEYMPVVLAALEAALDPDFTLHGILCSTCFTAPLIIVNGPIARRIGMNSGLNVLGQGNRANATMGRALNLIVRNVGGGRPGEIDRATFGAPSKYTFCFAEDESDEEWEPLSVSRGVPRRVSAVTLFQGEGVQGIMDQRSRTPEELTASLATCLLAVCHPKICEWAHAVLLLSPEHYAIYREAGWRPGAHHRCAARGDNTAAERGRARRGRPGRGRAGLGEAPPRAQVPARRAAPRPGRRRGRTLLRDPRRLARRPRLAGITPRHERDRDMTSPTPVRPRRPSCTTPPPNSSRRCGHGWHASPVAGGPRGGAPGDRQAPQRRVPRPREDPPRRHSGSRRSARTSRPTRGGPPSNCCRGSRRRPTSSSRALAD